MRERIDSAFLLAQAAKCRRLADAISESETTTKLRELAAEYEAQAHGSKRRLSVDHPGAEIVWAK